MSYKNIYVAIDNGTTGTIGLIREGQILFTKVPTKSEQNYTKKKGNITRIDVSELVNLLKPLEGDKPFAIIERPFVNPKMFKATISAVRALEAVLNVLEFLRIPYRYIDSKEWQKEMLPEGTKGTPALKKASMDIGCRLFPEHREAIEKHGDADGLLMAEYLRRTL
jgi:hypothetical protein